MAFDPEKDIGACLGGNGVWRWFEVLMDLVIRLVSFEQRRLFSVGVSETEYLLPQTRVFGPGMRDDAGVTLAPDMLEAELGEIFQRAYIAMFFSERGPFNFGEVLEPADTAGADGFVTIVG